ncbi:MAG TPA: T9SS type A sorting domain-containing protein [Candidatus Marinimicrobia bacterium]|nr:T9SS type A sorting domain-containing protein [Candidatus Neomarinimicrobiota bacterium]
MKKMLATVLSVLLVATMAFGAVNVTFRANTSMVQGITDTTGYVDIRGNLQVGDPGSYQDGDWTGDVDLLTNVGGDYWEKVWSFDNTYIGTNVEFKFGGAIADPITGDLTSYWENDLPGGQYLDNRSFVIPAQDTVLDMAYVGHPWGVVPFEDDPDSLDVYFRVNMSNDIEFDPAKILSWVGGGNNANGEYVGFWNPGMYALTQEGESGYWNIHMRLPLDGAPYIGFMYRFHNNGTDWDGHSENVADAYYPDNENRGIDLRADTTVQWVWWNNEAPSLVEGDTISITFRADLTNAIVENGFDVDDSLCVRFGYFNTAVYAEAGMTRVGFAGNTYEVTVEELVMPVGGNLFYQYYKIPAGGAESREVYFNFDYTGSNNSEAERREVVVGADGFEVVDMENSNVDARRMPRFRNTNVLSQDVTVTFELDLRPAYRHVANGIVLNDIQGNFTVNSVDQIDEWGVFMNGPASGGWTQWGSTLQGTEEKKMWDDGTHGDAVAGDSVYTVIFTYGPDSSNNLIGQEFKFGIGGGDNESGYGLNHIENINDSDPTFTLFSAWGSINPNFYYLWDFDNNVPTSVEPISNVPAAFALNQNYPNPFNPTTTIEFSIPEMSNVSLVVYNALGQVVRTFDVGLQNAGSYRINWDGTNDFGAPVSTGLYFYNLKAGNHSATMKMIYIK